MAIYRVPGPCTIFFGTAPLGISKAGVSLRIRTTWTPITDDAHGTEPADLIFTGKSAQVEIVGLDVALLKAAAVWAPYGGLLMSVTNGLLAIGALASALGQRLDIVERGGVYTWTALATVPTDPDPITLASTAELQLPTTFLVVPDVNGKLFSTLPPYLV